MHSLFARIQIQLCWNILQEARNSGWVFSLHSLYFLSEVSLVHQNSVNCKWPQLARPQCCRPHLKTHSSLPLFCYEKERKLQVFFQVFWCCHPLWLLGISQLVWSQAADNSKLMHYYFKVWTLLLEYFTLQAWSFSSRLKSNSQSIHGSIVF